MPFGKSIKDKRLSFDVLMTCPMLFETVTDSILSLVSMKRDPSVFRRILMLLSLFFSKTIVLEKWLAPSNSLIFKSFSAFNSFYVFFSSLFTTLFTSVCSLLVSILQANTLSRVSTPLVSILSSSMALYGLLSSSLLLYCFTSWP